MAACVPSQTTIIPVGALTVPCDKDVLFGRGASSSSSIRRHPGNILFRAIVETRRQEYMASCRPHKHNIAQAVIKQIQRRGGRFLMRKDNGEWVVAAENRVLEKTAQALRQDASTPRMKDQILNETAPKDKKKKMAVFSKLEASQRGESPKKKTIPGMKKDSSHLSKGLDLSCLDDVPLESMEKPCLLDEIPQTENWTASRLQSVVPSLLPHIENPRLSDNGDYSFSTSIVLDEDMDACFSRETNSNDEEEEEEEEEEAFSGLDSTGGNTATVFPNHDFKPSDKDFIIMSDIFADEPPLLQVEADPTTHTGRAVLSPVVMASSSFAAASQTDADNQDSSGDDTASAITLAVLEDLLDKSTGDNGDENFECDLPREDGSATLPSPLLSLSSMSRLERECEPFQPRCVTCRGGGEWCAFC